VRRHLLAGAALSAALVVPAAPAAAAGLSGRAQDPIVLTGATAASLRGAAPGDIVAFAWHGAWTQVPVQVDQRLRVDLGQVYGGPPDGVVVEEYADPNTFTGPDPDPTLNGDDEIALLARDVGDQPPGGTQPAGVAAGSRLDLRVTDPLQAGAVAYVSLFRRSDARLDPGAGRHDVSYDFRLASGDYRTTYKRNAGPNPENSTVTTPFYHQHFSDRWVDDGLSIVAGGASGVDVLDRHKSLFAPGNCARTENTFSAGEGAFVVNKVGPVRAIRTYLGANSGPLTERQHVFYPSREDIRTSLRVHPIGGILDVFDYSPAAAGMTYRNSANPLGATVDGVPDAISTSAALWEQVTGSQGSLTIAHSLDTDIPVALSWFHEDDSTPPDTQCTGDAQAFATSGPWLNGSLPNTDPRSAPVSRLTALRSMYFDPPGASAAEAARHWNDAVTPLAAAAVPVPATPPAGLLRMRLKLRTGTHRPARGARLRLSGSVCPARRGVLVRIQRLAGRRLWRTVARARAGSGRRCSSFLTRLRIRTGMTLRATVSGDRQYATGTSGSVRLRLLVRRRR
jgi:hypothetical protein